MHPLAKTKTRVLKTVAITRRIDEIEQKTVSGAAERDGDEEEKKYSF